MAAKRYDLTEALGKSVHKTLLNKFLQSKGSVYESGKLLACTDIVNKSVTFEVQYATRIMHGHKAFTNLIEAVEFYNNL